MAEHEVSSDNVNQAAERLQGEGRPVTIDAVRDVLGAGAVGDIGRGLLAWRSARVEAAAAPDAGIPAPVAAALGNWLAQYAQEAGAPAREALAHSQADLQAMLDTHAGLEAERDELETARAQAVVTLAERDETIERLNAELRNAKEVAMEALVSKAKDQLAIEGKDSQIAQLRTQLERSVAESAAVSDARLAAEMELVGATTARDSLAAEARDLRAQLDALHAERSGLRAEIEILKKRG